ncbi:diaminopimelate decarboxylase [Laribacter hongkongensis]|uniref:Diaminopimelate decarboxylase n=1 Tax=Laribacter hongkongensis TaxID=168471 RepID=A0ABD4SSZ9_9NEIS|nr:diaminopimelate decarboxylase [Laribacter hongkongensis]MCG9026589.1 diaminopimelate decarboxylase [Laribacter hongkongensis]MCG9031712.1 diaminopimelate decarboxylase [Laribacter hongkongensis]MCG9053680.1 diaminopimelate decarboxylase [Laribacter hongkongensis]MCG9055710.1 diaminopimelate decarboxylase [Laribacter hongkongensis]MCG9076539.1 diaminopimelate decarboxylase [Laribacter hongkongensis]
MNAFHYQNRELCVEDIPLARIAEQYGTPCYVYAESALTQAYSAYSNAFAGMPHLVCYALKANSNLSVIRHFASLGAGFDTVSIGEIERVLAAGGEAGKIVFSGVGKSAAEMRRALEIGIHCFNVESVNELERLDTVARELGKRAPVSLRINPNVDARTHPYISTGLKNNKFGIAYDIARQSYRRAAELPNLDVIGIDCHIGSQLTDSTPLIDALDRLLALVDQLSEDGIRLRHVDIGGGLGIRYADETPPDLQQYADAIRERLAGRDLALLMEPGRSLVGNAGVLLTRVEYLKEGDGKHFAVVDAAMNDLMRPSYYQAFHDIRPVTQHDAELLPALYDVVGPICESSDFLGKDRALALREGDLIAVMSSGAYGSTMSSNYNTRPRAAEVLVNGRHVRLVRARETFEQLIANEIDLLD